MSTQLQTWINGGKKNKQQEFFETWKGNYSFYFQLILYFLQTFLSPPSANIPQTVCSYSIQSYTNMFGTFYSWALWSWQFQLSHHHWWQQTTLLPTADTLNSLKLQASFPSSPTRCLHTCNTILWRAASPELQTHWFLIDTTQHFTLNDNGRLLCFFPTANTVMYSCQWQAKFLSFHSVQLPSASDRKLTLLFSCLALQKNTANYTDPAMRPHVILTSVRHHGENF